MQVRLYDTAARTGLLDGAEELYNAVRVTMGPLGRNVIIRQKYGVTETHDGVTVAKAVRIKNGDGRSEGADLILGAAAKTNDKVGDGTTTSTVLAYHLINEASAMIASGHNPMQLKVGLEAATRTVLAKLDDLKEDITKNPDRLEQVATVSAGEPELGKLIATVMQSVGGEGSVTIEPSQSHETTHVIVEGFKIDRGFVSDAMTTDLERTEADLLNPYILVTDQKIATLKDILPLIERLIKIEVTELVVFADDIAADILDTLIYRLKGSFTTVAIKPPAFGERRREALEDIAILTGARFVTENLSDVLLDDLGKAERLVATAEETTIIRGLGVPSAIDTRIKELKIKAKEAKSDFDRESYLKRQAALQGKVGIIRVGGATESEISGRKDRVDDALSATKAALAEGIVTGGGVTLIELSKLLKVTSSTVGSSQDAGELILKKALVQPFRQIMTNAGLNPDEKLPVVLTAKAGFGFDIFNPDDLVDLRSAGVVDPVMVTREAIRNAVSVATSIMTGGAVITNDEEE